MASDKSEAIEVVGLRDFQAELKKINLQRDLRLVNLEAAQMVAEKARSRAESVGGVMRKAAPSIKAAAEQQRAKITLGSDSYPFALGAEFGGHRRPTTQQFVPWTGHEGRALFPTIRETRDEFMEIYAKGIDRLFHNAFPN